MTREEIDKVMSRSNSCLFPIPGMPLGVTSFQAFLAIKPILKDGPYWYALNQAYFSSDNLYPYRADVKLAFLSDFADRDQLMNDHERGLLSRLPDQITIYRGMTIEEYRSQDFGVSWTLDRTVADFFANDYVRNFATKGQKTMVHEVVADKKDIIAYFDGREESEVIYISQNDKFLTYVNLRSKT